MRRPGARAPTRPSKRASCDPPAEGVEPSPDLGELDLGSPPPLLDHPCCPPELEDPELAQVGVDEEIGLPGADVPELVLHDLQSARNDVEAVRQIGPVAGAHRGHST